MHTIVSFSLMDYTASLKHGAIISMLLWLCHLKCFTAITKLFIIMFTGLIRVVLQLKCMKYASYYCDNSSHNSIKMEFLNHISICDKYNQ